MQALRTLFAPITKRLPARSTVLTVILVLAAVCLVSFVSLLLLYRARHPFWRTQPVAWLTVLPASEGRIARTLSEMPPPRDVPDGYTLHTLRTCPDQSDPLWRTLATLWNVCEGNEELSTDSTSDSTPPSAKHTPRSVYWRCRHDGTQLHTIRTSNNAIVATMVTTPTVLDTPAERNVHVFVVNHVCVHPEHRGKQLVPVLIGAAQPSQSDTPVGIFATELDFGTRTWHRLPFAEVAHTMRVYRTFQPTMLVDPSTEVNHTVVTDLKRLPKRAHESSSARVHGALRTLEPSAAHDARTRHWAHVIASPYDTLLSVGGDDWVHLHHPPTHDPTHALVFVTGCSFPNAQMVQLPKHVMQWVKRNYAKASKASKAPPRKHVTVIVPQPLARVFVLVTSNLPDTSRKAIDDTAASEWTYYDAHYVYMYNYRLRQKTTQVPFTMDIDVF